MKDRICFVIVLACSLGLSFSMMFWPGAGWQVRLDGVSLNISDVATVVWIAYRIEQDALDRERSHSGGVS